MHTPEFDLPIVPKHKDEGSDKTQDEYVLGLPRETPPEVAVENESADGDCDATPDETRPWKMVPNWNCWDMVKQKKSDNFAVKYLIHSLGSEPTLLE